MSQVALQWRKSSRCDANNCVEVAQLDNGVAVRDTARPETHILFDPGSWRALMQDIRSGRI